MSLSFTEERRVEPRMPLACEAKLFDPRGQRYYPARTINVSSSGALLELPQRIGADVGSELAVAVDWTRVHPMLASGDFRPVRLIRREYAGGAGGVHRIALRFAEPQAITHAA